MNGGDWYMSSKQCTLIHTLLTIIKSVPSILLSLSVWASLSWSDEIDVHTGSRVTCEMPSASQHRHRKEPIVRIRQSDTQSSPATANIGHLVLRFLSIHDELATHEHTAPHPTAIGPRLQSRRSVRFNAKGRSTGGCTARDARDCLTTIAVYVAQGGFLKPPP